MNYQQMNRVKQGLKVICIQGHCEFKKGDVAVATRKYYGDGFYYTWVVTEDGRTDVLDAFYKYWEISEVTNANE